jgi:hypothetical protein
MAGDPAAVPSGALELSVGQAHACARLEDGTVTCWGRADIAQGTGSPFAVTRCNGVACQPRPEPAVGPLDVSTIATGGATTCVGTEQQQVQCWGALYADRRGVPLRVPGPWEAPQDRCADTERTFATRLYDVLLEGFGCQTDDDCTEVELGVSCLAGCSSGPVEARQAARIEQALSSAETERCPTREAEGCASITPACPETTGTLACVESACVRFDEKAADCESPCECLVRDRSLEPFPSGACDGADLLFATWAECASCEENRVYFALANAGDARFDGVVGIQASAAAGPSAELPQPLSVELSLDPGAHSEPLSFTFSGARPESIQLRLDAPGDCALDDNEVDVLLSRSEKCDR